MNQKSLFLFICSFVLSFASFSQCAIKGTLLDTANNPLSFAAVGLLNYKDSSVYKGVLADENGNYCFEKINKGAYFLKISSVGFNTYYSDKVMYDSINLLVIPIISLKSAGIDLNEVSITVQKKIVEFKNGNVTV